MLIKIKNLEITCNIGVYDWEKNHTRKLNINVEIEVNNNKSCTTDNISDTLDYENIYNEIKKIINSKKYNLIESLANDILLNICQNKLVKKAKVEIDKIRVFDDVESFTVVVEKKL